MKIYYTLAFLFFGAAASLSANHIPPSVACNITATVQPIPCVGNNTGSITAMVSAQSPYSLIKIKTGGSPDTITGLAETEYVFSSLAAGTYRIVLIANDGCRDTVSNLVVGQAPNPTVTITRVQPSCNLQNGSATANPGGGTGIYQYIWQNGPATQIYEGIGPGTYTVTVTDALGCITSTSTVLTNSGVGPTVNTNTTNVSCNGGSDGKVEITNNQPNGTTYLWSNNATTQNISGLTANTYTVTVTSVGGCPTIKSSTVTEPLLLGISGIIPASAANCGLNTGSFTVAWSGGTSPYHVTWSPGNGNPPGNQSSPYPSPANLAPGLYSVTVSDNKGCVTPNINNTVTISGSGAIVIATPSITNPSCIGGEGSFSINWTGGTIPYTVAWGSTSAPASSNTYMANSVAPGNYTVTVSDGNNCSGTVSVQILQGAGLTANIEIVTGITCNGGKGKIKATPGPIGYTYLWSFQNQTTQEIQNLGPGTYTVTVTSAASCAGTATQVLVEPTSITAMVLPASPVSPTSSNLVICKGTSTGKIVIQASGGTQRVLPLEPYIVSWTNPSGSTSINPLYVGNNRFSLEGLTEGNYIITVTDANGCTTSLQQSITSHPEMLLSTLVTPPTCVGSNNGQINLTISGGATPFTYNWADITVGAEPQNRTGLPPATYTVTVTDGNSCTKSVSATVIDPPKITATLVAGPGYCQNSGAASTLSINISNGTPNYQISINNGAISGTATGAIWSTTVNPANAGNYQYAITSITDSKGCTLGANEIPPPVNIIVADSVTFNIVGNNTVCSGTSLSLGTNLCNTGINYTYNWRRTQPQGGSVAVSTLCSFSIIPVQEIDEALYSVTVTAPNGCIGRKTAFITVNPSPQINASLSTGLYYCEQDNITLQGSIQQGGTAPFTWTWTGPSNYSGSNQTVTISSAATSASGKYSLKVTDNNGCMGTDETEDVSVYERPITPTSYGDRAVCQGLPNPELSVNPNNEDIAWYGSNTPGANSLANGADYTPPSSINNPDQSPYTYYAFSKKDYGNKVCFSSTSASIRLYINKKYETQGVLSEYEVCEDQYFNPIVLSNLTSNSTGEWYFESLSGNPQILANSFSPTTNGQYIVRIKSLYNNQSPVNVCYGSPKNFSFERFFDPEADMIIPNLYQGQATTLQSVPIYGTGNTITNYGWVFQNGAPNTSMMSSESVIFNPAGTVQIIHAVTDNNICKDTTIRSATVNPTNQPNIDFSNTQNNISKCIGENFIVEALINTPGSYNLTEWQWTFPSAITLVSGNTMGGSLFSKPTFSATTAGTWPVTVEAKAVNSSNVTFTFTNTVLIKVNPKPQAVITIDPLTVCEGSNPIININFTGATPYKGKLTAGAEIKDIAQNSTTYSITVASAINDTTFIRLGDFTGGGCGIPDILDTIIPVPKPIIQLLDTVCTPSNQFYTLTLGIQGTAMPYSLTVNGQQIQPNNNIYTAELSNNQPFTVESIDANGCKSTIDGTYDCACSLIPGSIKKGFFNIVENDFSKENICAGEDIVFEVDNLQLGIADTVTFYLKNSGTGAEIANTGYSFNKKIDNNRVIIDLPDNLPDNLLNKNYSIEGVMRNIDENRQILTDGCEKDVVNTLYFKIFDLPKIVGYNLDNGNGICAGETGAFQFYTSGQAPFKLDFSIADSIYNLNNVYSPLIYYIPNSTLTDTALVIHFNAITSNITGCSAAIVDLDTTITVFGRPQYDVQYEQAICYGESLSVTVTNPQTDWDYFWNTPLLKNQAFNEINVNLPLGLNVFKLSVVNEKGCASRRDLDITVLNTPEPVMERIVNPNASNFVDQELCLNLYGAGSEFEANISGNNNFINEWSIYKTDGSLVQLPYIWALDPKKEKVRIHWAEEYIDPENYWVVVNQISQGSLRTCIGRDTLNIKILGGAGNVAPDITSIELFEQPIKVLIAVDSNVCYQWGYEEKFDDKEINIFTTVNAQSNIFPIPDGYSLDKYYFWVDTWFPDDNGTICNYESVKNYCATRSYYILPDYVVNPTNELDIQSAQVSVIPNPNSGIFNLRLEHVPLGMARIRMFDYAGRMVHDNKINIDGIDQLIEINHKELSAGAYALQILLDDGTVFIKTVLIQYQ